MWRYNLANYVTTYKVEYSYDGNYWVPYIGDNENDTRKGYTVSEAPTLGGRGYFPILLVGVCCPRN